MPDDEEAKSADPKPPAIAASGRAVQVAGRRCGCCIGRAR